jgi:hypothetical protein
MLLDYCSELYRLVKHTLGRDFLILSFDTLVATPSAIKVNFENALFDNHEHTNSIRIRAF